MACPGLLESAMQDRGVSPGAAAPDVRGQAIRVVLGRWVAWVGARVRFRLRPDGATAPVAQEIVPGGTAATATQPVTAPVGPLAPGGADAPAIGAQLAVPEIGAQPAPAPVEPRAPGGADAPAIGAQPAMPEIGAQPAPAPVEPHAPGGADRPRSERSRRCPRSWRSRLRLWCLFKVWTWRPCSSCSSWRPLNKPSRLFSHIATFLDDLPLNEAGWINLKVSSSSFHLRRRFDLLRRRSLISIESKEPVKVGTATAS
jgi:hypothetical protein